MSDTALQVQRLRHPLALRRLQVIRTRLVTPQLLCVTLAGPDLAGFTSASFDDHIKVFLPEAGATEPVLPELGPNGPVFSDTLPRPTARDYTPRRHDPAAGELDIEFVLHGDGPACSWAAQAKVGDRLGIGGPRGSFVIPPGFDWHLLVGDDTALPAIARRLAELPASSRAIVVLELEQADCLPPLPSAARLELHCRYRAEHPPEQHSSLLASAVAGLERPAGEGYAWAAGELRAIQAVRQQLLSHWQLDKSRIRAASYWQAGASNSHQNLDQD